MNTSSGWVSRLLVAGLLLVVTGIAGPLIGHRYDRYSRPWAFSETAPRLVGSWRTTFQDPDGLRKQLTLTVEPPAETFSWLNLLSRRRKHHRTNYRAFEGAVSVTSQRGIEQYELWGAVDRDDDKRLSLNTRVVDEKTQLLPNFALGSIKDVRWQGTTITMSLSFHYRRADGSSLWSSRNPRLNQVRQLTLTR